MNHIGEELRSIERPELVPIKTEYHGHLFRSRLEARWAVFLDLIEVPWRYEAEGFELASGRYLPDFEIDLGREPAYIEVKPYDPTMDELRKAHHLAAASERKVIVTRGAPDNDRADAGLIVLIPRGDGMADEDSPCWFCCCPVCNRVGVEWGGRGARVCGACCGSKLERVVTSVAYADAARQAKARRFWG